MASFLYKLGLFASKRSWLVIFSWVLLLGVTGTLAATAGGSFTTTMSVPGTPAQNTVDALKASFPKASNGSGAVAFATENGKPFTAAQKAAITNQLNQAKTLPTVASIMDPFATEKLLLKQQRQLAKGAKQLAAAPKDLAAGQKKITDGLAALTKAQADLAASRKTLQAQAAQLAAGIKQLEAALSQATAGGAPAAQIAGMQAQLDGLKANQAKITAGFAQLDAGQAQIDANKKKLADAQTALDKAKKDLPAQQLKLEAGQKLLNAASGFRTVSKGQNIAVGNVFFKKPLNQITAAQKADAVKEFTSAKISGVNVEVSQDLTQNPPSVFGVGESIGLLIAAVVLFIIVGTFVGAGLPLIAAVLGVGIAATATMALSAVVSMGSTTLSLGGMLGLAVGIDYTLFIINRHRRQLKAGMELRESLALANGTSGSAVFFAGLTVIIALAALNLTGIGFLGIMGTVGAAAIAIAVVVAVTFTPAFLSLLGMRILSKKEKKALELFDDAHPNTPERVSTQPVFANKRPWITLAGSALLLALIATPILSLRLGLPDGASENTNSTQYKEYKLVEKGFGVGMNGPLVTVVSIPKKLGSTDALQFEAEVATRISALKNVSAAVYAATSSNGKILMFQVLPTGGPTSVATEQLVRDLRGLDTSFKHDYNASVQVTGLSAMNIDISQKLSDALPLYLSTVMILSLILLMIVFRSIAVPLVATAGFLLSVFAALGAVTAVFQWGWLGSVFDVHDPGPILAFLPTMVIGILFGLAMDYQLFLVSGMREAYVHGKTAKESINYGIHLSRQVVVAAAIIMISVFGSFAFSEQVMLRAIGFGLATGVLFDAFFVRLMFVPALMTVLGDKAWYIPKWLDKVLPDVDVEGAQLERTHPH